MKRSVVALAAGLCWLLVGCSTSVHVTRAEEAAARQDWASAVEHYRLALSEDPDDGPIRTRLDAAEYRLRTETRDSVLRNVEIARYDRIGQALDPLLTLFPRDLATWDYLQPTIDARITAHVRDGEHEMAVNALNPLLRYYPDERYPRETLIDVCLWHLDHDTMLSDFEGARLALEPAYLLIGPDLVLDDALTNSTMVQADHFEAAGDLARVSDALMGSLAHLNHRSEIRERLLDITGQRVDLHLDREEYTSAVAVSLQAHRALSGVAPMAELMALYVDTLLVHAEAQQAASEFDSAWHTVTAGLTQLPGQSRFEVELFEVTRDAVDFYEQHSTFEPAREMVLASLVWIPSQDELRHTLESTTVAHIEYLAHEVLFDAGFEVAQRGLIDMPHSVAVADVTVALTLSHVRSHGRDWSSARPVLLRAIDLVGAREPMVESLERVVTREVRQLRQGDQEAQAITVLDASLRRVPGNNTFVDLRVDITVDEVTRLVAAHDYHGAESVVESGLSRIPDEGRLQNAYVEIAVAQLREPLGRSDYRSALTIFDSRRRRYPSHPDVVETVGEIRDVAVAAVRAAFDGVSGQLPAAVHAESQFVASSFPGDTIADQLLSDAVDLHAEWRADEARTAEGRGLDGRALLFWMGAQDLRNRSEYRARVSSLRARLEAEVRFTYRVGYSGLLSGYATPTVTSSLASRSSAHTPVYRLDVQLGPARADETYYAQWGNVRYLAGYRNVANPAYHRLEHDIDGYQRQLGPLETRLDNLLHEMHEVHDRAEQDPTHPNHSTWCAREQLLEREAQQVERDLNTVRDCLDQARHRLASTPALVSEEVYEDHTYEIRDYTRTVSAELVFTSQLRGANVSSDRQTFSASTSDRMHPGFATAGLAEDRLVYPESDSAMLQPMVHLSLTRADNELQRMYVAHRDSFAAQGQNLQHSAPDRAMEAWVRYLLFDDANVSATTYNWLTSRAYCAPGRCL